MAFVDYVVACFREHRLLTAEVSRLEARIAELEAEVERVRIKPVGKGIDLPSADDLDEYTELHHPGKPLREEADDA